MADIVMIPIDKLNPHPDNPRKELGDLSELAESIKAKGVLQNLTVVPYYSKVHKRVMDGLYTILIGHRRASAAKLAGLTELPCTIVDMSYEDQIATMLVENMQRSDLSIYEEAKGFQMMLDLGKTIQDVSAMSGFSEATVRRRVKLAELDEKKFKKAVERGATLFDFAEMDKIDDPAVKDDLLGKLGTKDWKNALSAAIENQKTKALLDKWAGQVSAFATKIDKVEWQGSQKTGFIGDRTFPVEYVTNYSKYGDKGKDAIKPEDDGAEEYFFVQKETEITLYKKWKRNPEAERKQIEDKIRADAYQKLKGQFTEMTERHRKLRLDFVKNFNQYQKRDVNVLEFVTEAMIDAKQNGGGYSNNASITELAAMLGVKMQEGSGPKKLDYAEFLSAKMQHPERTALITAMWILDTGKYWRETWDAEESQWHIVYSEDPDLDMVYRLLGSLGYVSSTEEVELRGGTHNLFYKKEGN